MNFGIQRLTTIATSDLIKLLMDIDNGMMDRFLEETERYNEMNYYRKCIVDILIGRYLFFRENPQKVTNEEKVQLNDSYKLFLKNYI